MHSVFKPMVYKRVDLDSLWMHERETLTERCGFHALKMGRLSAVRIKTNVLGQIPSGDDNTTFLLPDRE